MNAANADASAMARPSGFQVSLLPELRRSEAFVEDLFDSSGFTTERPEQAAVASRVWSVALQCGVPLLVALAGGALAFFQGIG